MSVVYGVGPISIPIKTFVKDAVERRLEGAISVGLSRDHMTVGLTVVQDGMYCPMLLFRQALKLFHYICKMLFYEVTSVFNK